MTYFLTSGFPYESVLTQFMTLETRQRVYQYIKDNHQRWITLLQRVIQIPSTFEQEQKITAFIESYLQQSGVEIKRIYHDAALLKSLPDAQPPFSPLNNRYSLAARIPGTGGGRSMVLNTHLDTVAAGDESMWLYPPLSGAVDEVNRRIYGRGAMDDKAGVVITLAVLDILKNLPHQVAGDVVFHFVLEDETTGNGTLLCLNQGYKADAAVIIDGTRKDFAYSQHTGQLQFKVSVRGKPAPVVVSHTGINAAEMLSELILLLRDTVFRLNANRAKDWQIYPSPFQLSTLSLLSEASALTVPAEASATFHVTFPPPFTLAQMETLLQQTIHQFSEQKSLPQPAIYARNGVALEPVFSPGGDFEAVFHASIAEAGLKPVDIRPSTGISDLRHFIRAGIPALLYGPGTGYNPHRYDEYYQLDDLPDMIQFFVGLVSNWCK